MESIYEMAGRKIQILRKSQGLTQQELAEKSDLSIPFVSQIESGKKKASLETYSKLANSLGVDLGELFQASQRPLKKPLTLKNLNPKQQELLEYFLKSL